MKQTPLQTYRSGPIQGSIWRKKTDKGKMLFSVSIRKRHRNKEGEWKDTHVFFPDDLPHLQTVAEDCRQFIREHQ